jgi:hypothetical protein
MVLFSKAINTFFFLEGGGGEGEGEGESSSDAARVAASISCSSFCCSAALPTGGVATISGSCVRAKEYNARCNESTLMVETVCMRVRHPLVEEA